MRRRRIVTEEERELWGSVARTVRMRAPAPQQLLADTKEAPKIAAPSKTVADKKAELRSFVLGEKARSSGTHTLLPTLAETLESAPLRMDAKTHSKMTKGRLTPEARIDLHGMTLAQAHSELIAFLLGAHSAGLRLVLVITGKGKLVSDHGPIPVRIGAIRHQLPNWLRLPPLVHIVLQVTESHYRHGGSGAYYVYLRRR